MSVALRFPAELPPPDRDGYQDEFEEARTAVEMENGPKRRRQKTRIVPRIFSVQWTMSQAEFHIFDTWWQETIRGGESEFDIQLSDDFDDLTWYTVRAIEEYAAKYIEDGEPYWLVSTKLRAVNPTFGPTRSSGTAELHGLIEITTIVRGRLQVYSPLRGKSRPTATLRAMFAPILFRARCEVGLKRLPRARFLVIVHPGYPELSRQWERLTWLRGTSSRDILAVDQAIRREWMEI